VAALDAAPLAHLILVAGHAVYVGGEGGSPESDSEWLLEPYQVGEPPLYIQHVRAGVALAAAEPGSLLVFSGGQTRKAAPWSEARGYLTLAQRFEWWSSHDVAARAVVEEFARDSFENLLFGICRFRECAGRYPDGVTVVSWGFKAPRFDLHRETLRWPASRFRYCGVNEPHDVAGARRGEAATVASFQHDSYGTGTVLGQKRAARDLLGRRPPYEDSCPELAGLLRYAGPEPFRGPLPWLHWS
jgi:hypothetical protein